MGELERNMKGDEPIRMWLNEEDLGFITPSPSLSFPHSLSLSLSLPFLKNNKEQGNYHRFLNEKEAGFESSCVCVCVCECVCVELELMIPGQSWLLIRLSLRPLSR